MTLVRSIIYTIYLFASMTFVGLMFLPGVIVSGRSAAARAAHVWAKMALAGLRVICGITHEVRGLDKLPSGAALIACKHEAMWETLFFLALFKDPAVVLKKELLELPIYGWYAAKLEMIVVDREQGASAIRHLARQAEQMMKQGRPLVIFPEGTRMAPGAPPDYKPGIALLYQRLGLPVVPAALNSGLYWQGGIKRRPGRIVIEFLDPIPPGLERAAFMATLQGRIETACQALRDGAEADAMSSQNRLKVADA